MDEYKIIIGYWLDVHIFPYQTNNLNIRVTIKKLNNIYYIIFINKI